MHIKVLYIIPTLNRSGAEKQLTLIASNLPREQFEVRVVVLTHDGPYSHDLEKANIPVVIVGKRQKFSLNAYFKLKKYIKEFQPDIVHTWLFAANSYGRQAAFACNVPVVICGERCLDPWKANWQTLLDRKLEPKTSIYAINSTGIADFYSKRGIPEDKFVVIPNAVEFPAFFSSHFEKNLLKKHLLLELGLPSSENKTPNSKNDIFDEMNISSPRRGKEDTLPYLIGLVGRFWPQKRIRDALWAADQIKFSQLNFYLLILGDGPERPELLRYRDDLQIEDRVLFLGERNDVSHFMPCFDILWNCSAYEGQSNSILEAQAYGVPVIASDVPGNRDLIISGKNGLLISEFNGDETRRRTAFSRETIKLLKSDKGILSSMGEFAQKRIQIEFSIEKVVKRHAELYEQLVCKRQRRCTK